MQRSLLERDSELAEANALVASAGGGRGRLIAVEGPAGIGKTRLLEAVGDQATRTGMRVISAVGSELERDFAFGVVRQLLDPLLSSARDRQRLLSGSARHAAPVFGVEHSPGEAEFAILDGLYRLVAKTAERKPLMVAVDDAHWADAPSLRFLAFLAPRLRDVPVLVSLALRLGEPIEDGAKSLEGMLMGPHAAILRPKPLTEHAVAQLVRAEFGTDADERFCSACQRAVAGNPFFLRELVTELRRAHVAPVSEEAERIRSLGPRAVSRTVLLRLGRLPPAAVELARAIAVLGDGAELYHAAALAGLELAHAAEAADALTRISILRSRQSLTFVHPIVRTAIAQDIQPHERARRHAEAARLLAGAGAGLERVAAHLMATAPSGEAHVVETLRQSAQDALERGAPETAVAHLRRALAEPPSPHERAELLLLLGSAEQRIGDPEGLGHLRQAAETAADPAVRARALIELARAEVMTTQRMSSLHDALGHARDAISGEESALALQLETESISAAILDPSTATLAAERLAAIHERLEEGDRQPTLLATLAYRAAQVPEPVEKVVGLAKSALEGGRLLAEQTANSPPFLEAAYALLLADRLDEAKRWYQEGLSQAGEQGHTAAVAVASSFRSHLEYRRGDIDHAEADARTAMRVAEANGLPLILAMAAAFLADALLQRGELSAAAAALEHAGFNGEMPPGLFFTWPLYSRARLRLAQGRTQEGLQELLECGDREMAVDARNPARFAWRSQAALALRQLGDSAEARRLALEELQLARAFGAPRALGIALTAAGLLECGETGIDYLREATDVLGGCNARLEHARTLTELGAALRRANRRTAAREPLRRGMDLAHRCGATALEESAREELCATGARPRRLMVRGLESLTACERRAAEMAAEGLRNREIAQSLYVTVKTVEKHLSGAYSKLGVRSRAELANALTAAGDGARASA